MMFQKAKQFLFHNEKFVKIMKWFFYVLGLVVLTCYLTQLYTAYAIDRQQVLPRNDGIFILVLRWLTIMAVGLATVTPFFGGHKTRLLLSVFAFVIGVLNLIFFHNNMVAWGMGREAQFPAAANYAYDQWRVVFFIIEQIALILISLVSLYHVLKDEEYKKFKPIAILWEFLIVIGLALCYLYGYFFEDLFIIVNHKMDEWTTTDFSKSHIIFLLLNFVLIIGLYLLFRDKDDRQKIYMLLSLGLGSVFSFFNCSLYGLDGVYPSAIPIHICNLATVLITISYAFKLKGIFYFTFFVNVIGTIFAMIMPDSDYIALSYDGLRFWYNHIIVFVAPILGVVLKVYERPKLKDIGASIIVFTIYFLLAATMNAVFNSIGKSANYFFINDDFYLDKIKWYDCPLRDPDYQWVINIGGHDLVFYPAYHSLIYIIYIGLMFLLWYLYDTLFLVGDAHRNLHIRKMLKKQGYLDLKKLLNGRSLKDPLYEEAKGMIEIKDFTKVYAGSTEPSVDHLNLTIKDGEVYGFLGHNGAGKSTTIKSLVGIQSITDGQILVDGYDVAKQPVEAKLLIGYVSDNHAVYEKLTGREYINYIADLYMVSQEDRDARIEKYVKMFKLEEAIDREAKSYSHGMKQKLVVIASLIHEPKVWVLDEPLTGLDPTSAYQIKECMKEHAEKGNIVFFSSHVIEVVEKICTRICIISHGKLMCEYSLKELKEKGISLEDLYLKYVSSQERID